MYDTLRELHRKFWKELPIPKLERQYDEAFRELMRRLEKSERKLVLWLLDTRGLLAENAAFDSFACGFRLALELTTESQQHKKRTVRGSFGRSLRNGGGTRCTLESCY